jgi:hypothetical protein
MDSLAEQDIERALSYLARVTNRRDFENLANVVASRRARQDPERALAWARENDTLDGDTYRQVLMTIAADAPEFAMQQAQALTNPMQRYQATMTIAMSVSHRDPEKAIALIEQIPDGRERQNLGESLTDHWVRTDPDGALSWLLKSELADSEAVMTRAAQSLAREDLDGAMRWLPRIGEEHQSAWRSAIAANLALQQSPAAAETFIARFQHSPDYPQLVASVAAGVARTDVEAAFRMAERIPSESARDSLYVQLIERQGQENPQQAAGRLALIADASSRSTATTQLAAAWAEQDPAAAEHWARNLASDVDRDHAITGLVWSWDELTPSRQALLESVTDPKVRRQGLMNHVWRVARSDVRRAESILGDIDLTDEERRLMERRLRMIRDQRQYVRY